jgi:Flp pilus assembly protein TadD
LLKAVLLFFNKTTNTNKQNYNHMKLYNKISTLFIAVVVLVSCTSKTNQTTNSKDYAVYLKETANPELETITKEIAFWQTKYVAAPNQKSYLAILASNYTKLFDITANIDYLLTAEKNLLEVNESYHYTKVNNIRSLARNYISQHRFKEALDLANKALAIGEGLEESQKLLFDVQMELGNYQEAEAHLNAIQKKNEFDYYIRIAKWNDHIGDLDTTLTFMEKAKVDAEKYDNKALKIWTYTNLGDYNGHAGNIEAAYQHYLNALAIDPNNSYALKGIAWIVFSHEKNTEEAISIINAIEKKHNSPDFYLLKAEIAEFTNNESQKNALLDSYFKSTSSQKYGAMYNKYNVLLFAEQPQSVAKALSIAEEEVAHRPTPVSYDLLAWTYLKMGQKEKALEIADAHVAGKSFEPELNYHLAEIYKANNKLDKIVPIKKDLMNSLFELGPNYEQKIKNL